MTIDKKIDEQLFITLGAIVSNVELQFTKTATGRAETLIPTVISSTQRWLVVEIDSTVLDAGEYSMEVIEDDTVLKEQKVTVSDNKEDLPEYDNQRTYTEYGR